MTNLPDEPLWGAAWIIVVFGLVATFVALQDAYTSGKFTRDLFREQPWLDDAIGDALCLAQIIADAARKKFGTPPVEGERAEEANRTSPHNRKRDAA